MVSLVTGGCGFIGSHMVDRLLKEGHEVRVIDNWTTGRPENLAHQKGNERLTIHHMDIRNREEIEPIFQGVDYVFHFAALADIVPSIQRPWDYYSSNVLGTYHVVPVMEFRTNILQKNRQRSVPSILMRSQSGWGKRRYFIGGRYMVFRW